MFEILVCKPKSNIAVGRFMHRKNDYIEVGLRVIGYDYVNLIRMV
jgi:hypothetical protein